LPFNVSFCVTIEDNPLDRNCKKPAAMSEIDQQSELNTFEVEITDLDASQRAGRATPGHLGRLLVRWQRPEYRRARRWLHRLVLAGLVSALLAVLLNPTVGITTLLAAHWPFLQASQTSLTASDIGEPPFYRFPDGIRCPSQAAWSPDSSYIAILGYTQSCAQDDYVPSQIDLYAASPVHRVAHWQPNEVILRTLLHPPDIPPRLDFQLARKPGPGYPRGYSTVPPVRYLQMLWSPDGKRLALIFDAPTRARTYEGVFLADVNGGHARVLLYPEPWQIDPGQWAPLQWNLQTGSAVELKTPAPALTYTWNAHDTLVPLAPATPASKSPYAAIPPGNPAGDRTFSIWQPGRPIVLSLMHTPGAYLWSSSFASWSPDGRFLITNFTVAGLMEPPGRAFPTPSALKTLGVKGVARVSVHDRALIPAASIARTVAWNPTGTLLAVYDLSGFVDLYDCQTGQHLRLLKPAVVQPLSGSTAHLLWSPDGRFLLLSSSQWGLITLWGVGNLLYSGVTAK